MLTTKSQPKTKSQTVNEDPAVREVEEKLAQLQASHSETQREIEAARLSRQEIPAESSRIEDEARWLLDGPEDAVATQVATMAQIDELTRRRNVIQEAVRLQTQRVEAVRGEVGREIAMAARPEYEAIVRRMAEALAVLSDAAEEEARFREKLDDQRINFASIIPPCPMKWARLNEYASKANLWLNEVERDYGIKTKVERRRNP